MSGNPTILSSRVRLARNYQDLPFDVAGKPDCAAMCVARTAGALRLSGNDEGFELLHLKDMGIHELDKPFITEIGQGNINFDPIIELAGKIGVRHYVV